MALDLAKLRLTASRIVLAVFDVDGVLTDGQLILGPNGQEYKAFHARDGHGLVALRKSGIEIAIIIGRRSDVVSVRMRELGIEHVYQGVADKRARLEALLLASGVAAEFVCYVGDDIPDVEAMRSVGLPIAVADAVPEVAAVAAGVTALRGGHGAAREVCDLILTSRPTVSVRSA
jgi:3-deoxy-D-manno-octulosonate 8-phosphate phosphatase (KDO 8-P phosphatase)